MKENLSENNRADSIEKSEEKKGKIKKHSLFFLLFIILIIIAFILSQIYYTEEGLISEASNSILKANKKTSELIASDTTRADNKKEEVTEIIFGNLLKIEDRLKALESRSNFVPTGLTELKDRLQRIEDQLSDISVEKIKGLEEEIKTLSKKLEIFSISREQTSILVINLLELRERVLSGHSFNRELNILEEEFSNNSDILNKLKELRPFTRGIDTPSTLRKEFSDKIKEAFQVGGEEGKKDWTTEVVDKIKGLIVIRKVSGRISEGSPDLIIARAEELVFEDKLQEASEELSSLPDRMLKIFKPWQEKVYIIERVKRNLDEVIHEVLFPAGVKDKIGIEGMKEEGSSDLDKVSNTSNVFKINPADEAKTSIQEEP